MLRIYLATSLNGQQDYRVNVSGAADDETARIAGSNVIISHVREEHAAGPLGVPWLPDPRTEKVMDGALIEEWISTAATHGLTLAPDAFEWFDGEWLVDGMDPLDWVEAMSLD